MTMSASEGRGVADIVASCFNVSISAIPVDW